jgi:SMC interacting uncharacterized protein involved in chromosome segregation
LIEVREALGKEVEGGRREVAALEEKLLESQLLVKQAVAQRSAIVMQFEMEKQALNAALAEREAMSASQSVTRHWAEVVALRKQVRSSVEGRPYDDAPTPYQDAVA